MTTSPSRRQILELSTIAAASSISFMGSAHADTALPANKHQGPAPDDVGRKFFANGRVRPFAGNTIICHIPQQGEGFTAFDSLVDIYRDLPTRSFSRKVAVLPTSSYHMTIFSGADDQSREGAGWPSDIPRSTSIEECNAIFAQRLEAFRTECQTPIRMTLDEAATQPELITLRLKPINDAENLKLRRFRDRLADFLKIRTPSHDSYRFHITIGYQLDWLTAAELAEFVEAVREWKSNIMKRAGEFTLGTPEYCEFKDMYSFERKLMLHT
jgi:hypothetical protein